MSPCRVLPAAFLLLLTGCALPQKVTQVEKDRARFDQEQSERATYDRCNQDAMPGTPQHLACRMAGEKNAGAEK